MIYLQVNLPWKKGVIYEQEALNKLIRENTFTSNYYWFETFIVAKWRVKNKL